MRYLLLLFPLLLLTSCVDDELAFYVEASPVKAEIERLADPAPDRVAFRGRFTELDKDGILDQNVGIVATPVAGLNLEIFSQDQQLLATVSTDDNGEVELTLDADDLDGVSRLEWAGTYAGRSFRILESL
jgi:hypothetical protein